MKFHVLMSISKADLWKEREYNIIHIMIKFDITKYPNPFFFFFGLISVTGSASKTSFFKRRLAKASYNIEHYSELQSDDFANTQVHA